MADGGVQGPFPGPDWQAECGAAREDRERLAREVAHLERRLSSTKQNVYGFLAELPGLCTWVVPNDNQAATIRGLEAEVERLRAANDRLAAERDRRAEAERGRLVSRLRALASKPENVLAMRVIVDVANELEQAGTIRGAWEERDRELATAHAEVDQLRAERCELSRALHERNCLRGALADMPMNTVALAVEWNRRMDERQGMVPARKWDEIHPLARQAQVAEARVWLASIRYLAGIKDSEAAGVNHDQRDVGAQAQPAGAAAAPTGQAGGAQSGSAGPPAGLGCACFHSPEQHHDNHGPGNWRRCAVYGCACIGVAVFQAALRGDHTVDAGIEVGPEGDRPREAPPAPTLSRVRLQQEHAELLAALQDLVDEADANLANGTSYWTATETARALIARIKAREATT